MKWTCLLQKQKENVLWKVIFVGEFKIRLYIQIPFISNMYINYINFQQQSTDKHLKPFMRLKTSSSTTQLCCPSLLSFISKAEEMISCDINRSTKAWGCHICLLNEIEERASEKRLAHEVTRIGRGRPERWFPSAQEVYTLGSYCTIWRLNWCANFPHSPFP